MGNCIRRDSAMQWGGDDWASSPVSIHDQKQEKGLLQEFSKSSNNKEVKIKISKKQLTELLGRVDMNELSVEQVLAQLINNITHDSVSDSDSDLHRSWKPNLQSIPE